MALKDVQHITSGALQERFQPSKRCSGKRIRRVDLVNVCERCAHPVGRGHQQGITDSFDVDFGVDQWHGHNVFFGDGDRVFRTYFINSRGDEAMGSTWSYLDATPLGRQETWEDSPDGYPQTPPYEWWNWHDHYSAAAAPNPSPSK
jgi:predicted dithiol-disulfide oxidoreductase (DUF899 family)